MSARFNLIFVFADQWRAQAFGYAGDPNVSTPYLNRFAMQSLNFSHAVSGCPVCSPYRSSLMTGVYPHRHGMMVNDQCLHRLYKGPFLGECLRDGGYRTAYIGKWHIDGNGRNAFVPPERRLGFEWWKGFECNHKYRRSHYYFGDDPQPYRWAGYDADAQTDEACRYLRDGTSNQPFALFLSWGPPHTPFGEAPSKFECMYDPEKIILPPNVPDKTADQARRELAGYYAHASALDANFGRLLAEIKASGLERDTIVIFTSDHGDMLGSQGQFRKQRPWAESMRVPFLIRHPRGAGPGVNTTPIDAPDLMPTLMALCNLPIPASVQGKDFSSAILDHKTTPIDAALLALYVPFHEWGPRNGGREYRGLHDPRYTYVRTLEGPWLLYDHKNDPYQLNNLVGNSEHQDLVESYDRCLDRRLQAIGDDFATGTEIVNRHGYAIDEDGDIAILSDKLPEMHPETNRHN